MVGASMKNVLLVLFLLCYTGMGMLEGHHAEVTHAVCNGFDQPDSLAVLSDLENFSINQTVYEEMGV